METLSGLQMRNLRSLMRGKINLNLNLAMDEVGYLIPKSQWDREPPHAFHYTEQDPPYGEIYIGTPEDDAMSQMQRPSSHRFVQQQGALNAQKTVLSKTVLSNSHPLGFVGLRGALLGFVAFRFVALRNLWQTL